MTTAANALNDEPIQFVINTWHFKRLLMHLGGLHDQTCDSSCKS